MSYGFYFFFFVSYGFYWFLMFFLQSFHWIAKTLTIESMNDEHQDLVPFFVSICLFTETHIYFSHSLWQIFFMIILSFWESLDSFHHSSHTTKKRSSLRLCKLIMPLGLIVYGQHFFFLQTTAYAL